MKNSFFNIIKHNNKNESYKEFDSDSLMKNVKMYETNSHFYIENFPGAFGNMQNKNNRVYDQNTLVYAANQFNTIKEENPYFCYILDGHKDDDGQENIVGKVITLKIDYRNKCILIDLKFNKGSKIQNTLSKIIMDGDPIGASMRIITPNVMTVTKEELKRINNNIIFLNDIDKDISSLLSNDDEIEFVTGNAYIQRFDTTYLPSFIHSYVSKPYSIDPRFNKKESIDKKSLIKNTTNFINEDNCITNSCKFRKEIKKFIDIINIEDIKILNNEKLYDSLLKFSYINLDWFDFNKIKDASYFKKTLIENDYFDINIYKNIINDLIDKNIINYLIDNEDIDYYKLNKMLINTINIIVDENNIIYQLITLNYLHFITLATIILQKKEHTKIKNITIFIEIINKNILKCNNNDSYIFNFIKNIQNNDNLYSYINNMFIYIYSYIQLYSDKVTPLTIINEAFKLFNKQTLTDLRYII